MTPQKRARYTVAAGLAGATALCTTVASAQAPAEGESPAESRAAAFQAVDPNAKKEDVPGGPLLIAAYGVILVLLVAYVARLGALYAKNRGELERLVRAVERGGRKD
ncbi:MAG: hypothetical protein ABW252_05475 [Polyangiales bacterium]